MSRNTPLDAMPHLPGLDPLDGIDLPRLDLHGKVAVVLGASSGLGRGLAIALAQRGAQLVLASRRTERLLHIELLLRETGAAVISRHCDVAKAVEVAALAQAACDEFGQIDLWINAAGTGALGYFWDIPPQVHACQIAANLTGLIHACHAALTQFRAQGHGVLINLGAADAADSGALLATTAASRAAAAHLGRSLNDELRLAGLDRTIKVVTVMPGAVDTGWWTRAANHYGERPACSGLEDPARIVAALAELCALPVAALAPEWHLGAARHPLDLARQVFPALRTGAWRSVRSEH